MTQVSRRPQQSATARTFRLPRLGAAYSTDVNTQGKGAIPSPTRSQHEHRWRPRQLMVVNMAAIWRLQCFSCKELGPGPRLSRPQRCFMSGHESLLKPLGTPRWRMRTCTAIMSQSRNGVYQVESSNGQRHRHLKHLFPFCSKGFKASWLTLACTAST